MSTLHRSLSLRVWPEDYCLVEEMQETQAEARVDAEVEKAAKKELEQTRIKNGGESRFQSIKVYTFRKVLRPKSELRRSWK